LAALLHDGNQCCRPDAGSDLAAMRDASSKRLKRIAWTRFITARIKECPVSSIVNGMCLSSKPSFHGCRFNA
jgi:hypothetical protein